MFYKLPDSKTMKERLRKKLWYLRESYGIIGVKGGTEVEDMSFEELFLLRDISMNIVPMTVKIGGPEARNDIRECLNIKVDGILAPMIESDYGFINFITTVKELAKDKLKKLSILINLETITGYYNINSIIMHPLFDLVNQVTVGRSDLAGSMDYPVNHNKVIDVIIDIIERVKNKNKLTSVGGKMDPISAQKIRSFANPHRLNTRHMIIELAKCKNLTFAICEALSFEIELYKLFMEMKLTKKSYIKRIEDTKLRMTNRDHNMAFKIG